jgi:hypothetical protein
MGLVDVAARGLSVGGALRAHARDAEAPRPGVKAHAIEMVWKPPPSWPIVEPGLLMAGIDDVMFLYSDTTLTERGFERQLVELAKAIDLRDDDSLVGVVYDAPSSSLSIDAKRRKRSAEVLDQRRRKLAKTTAGFALASPSTMMRGVLRAVFWLAPPPYPWAIVDTAREGLVYLKTKMPSLDVERTLAAYEALKRKHLR